MVVEYPNNDNDGRRARPICFSPLSIPKRVSANLVSYRNRVPSSLRSLTFSDEKKEAVMNRLLALRYQYSQCDRLRVPLAVDALFGHATGGYRS
jgi:hypothetical protein